MFIESTQPMINHALNHLKNLVGFMEVFKQLNRQPEVAAKINDHLVEKVGTYLVNDVKEYSPKVGEDVTQIIFEYLEEHPFFEKMFKSVKSHIIEARAAEVSDLINNLIKDPGPTI